MTAPARPQLTARQLEVLELSSQGRTYSEIAHTLGVKEITVRGYAHRLQLRLEARGMPHAVRLACLAGILDGRPQRHGDHAGYEAHRRRGEDPRDCPHGCWEGELAYRADRRQAKRGQGAASAPASRPEARKT